MRIVARAALTVVFLVTLPSALSAQTLSPAEQKLLDGINSNPEKKQEALARLNAISKAQDTSTQQKQKTIAKKVASTQKAATASPANKPDAITQLIQSNAQKAPGERQYSPCAGWVFLVRQSWKDLGGGAGAACPDDAKSAQGAQISFADDRAANNRVATINGTAAVVYNSVTGNMPAPLPYAVSFGAYTTVDDVSNSATSQLKSNVDTLAYGGLLELGFTGPFPNFLTLRGGGVQDYIKNTTAGNAVLDWTPVIPQLYIYRPYDFSSMGLPIITRFDVDLVARFDSATGKNQILAFNNMQDSLRLGPELTLNIVPALSVTGPLSRFSALLGYDVWYETYSKKQLNWFSSSLTYNIDEKGNFGINGTYNRGEDVNTGKWTNIYKIGLSGKI
jgi:hypothetical protein